MSKDMIKKEAPGEMQLKKQTNINDVAGFENFDSEKMTIPRIKLVQALSDEVSEGLAKMGDYVNSITKEVITEKGQDIELIPLTFSWSRIKFKPMAEGGGIACIAPDGKMGEGTPGGYCKECPAAKWTKDEKGNNIQECTEIFNVICIIKNGDDLSMPIVANFARTSAPAGKQFYNIMALQGMKGNSPWMFSYKLGAKFVDGDKGKYYISTIKPAGKAPEELVDYMENMYEMIKESDVEIHIDETEIKSEQSNIENNEPAPF